jgi:Secretion system C-terminal sorting domain
MKKITFVSALLLSFICFAQPVLNASDFGASYSATTSVADNTGLTPGLSGANRVWDFSSISLSPLGTVTKVAVSTAPFASTFPTANYCNTFNYFGSTGYEIDKISSTSFEVLGIINSGLVESNFNANSVKVLQFPFTFNTTFTDTYQELNDSAPTTIVVTYDAYGTLIMPYGTFTNVIRRKLVENGLTTYDWIKTNPFSFILTADFTSGGTLTAYQPNTLSIFKQTKTKNFSIYPNPTNGDFTISNSTFAKGILILYDTLGKVVFTSVLDNEMLIVSTNDLPSGLYFLKISNSENQIVHSEKILKN